MNVFLFFHKCNSGFHLLLHQRIWEISFFSVTYFCEFLEINVQCSVYILTLFRMGFFGAAHGRGKICQIYPTMMKLRPVIPYLKKVKKIHHMTHPLSSADSIFSPEISNFCYMKKYRYRLHFDKQFLILLTFRQSLNIFLINLVIIFMITAEMASPGPLKIMVLLNKGYDVIISVNDATNRILWDDSNYIVDVFMWTKFGNSSISMREAITTSTL